MKAISLHQPWASLVMLGHKHYETRSWSTKHRGPLAIHAAKTTKPWRTDQIMGANVLRSALFGHKPTFGAIIAVVQLLDVVPIVDPTDFNSNTQAFVCADPAHHGRLRTNGVHEQPGRSEYWFGDYTGGRYAWIFSPLVEILPAPLPYSGHQGIFNIPEDLTP